MEEKQPWASCRLTSILLGYLEDRAHGKAGLDYARCFRDVEGVEVPEDPEAFLKDVHNWVPIRVLREVLSQGEALTGQKDFAYHAARAYFRRATTPLPSLFEIILRVLNDVRSVLICANLFSSVQTNYLRAQAFERSDKPAAFYILTQFDDCARPGLPSISFLRGILEGFATMYPFIDTVECREEISQVRLEDIVQEFPEFHLERSHDRILVLHRHSSTPVAEARRVSLRTEMLRLSPEFRVTIPDLAVVLPEGGRLTVLTAEEASGPGLDDPADQSLDNNVAQSLVDRIVQSLGRIDPNQSLEKVWPNFFQKLMTTKVGTFITIVFFKFRFGKL